MFTSSKIKEANKELEQKLMARQAQLERYSQTLLELSARRQKAIKEFEQIEQEQYELDQSLTRVVGAIKETREAQNKKYEQEQEIEKDLSAFAGNMEQSVHSYLSLQKEMETQSKNMLAIVEHNKHFTDPARFLSQISGELKQEMERMDDCLLKMQEFGRQMGVLSLNAAIEAGRMGESGLKFVGAAEEVRSLAGQYQEAAESMNGQIGKITKRLNETQERVDQLNQLLKENNVKMGKTTQSFTDCVNRFGRETFLEFPPKAKDLAQKLGSILSDHAKDEEGFSIALTAMEQAGEKFVQEQQSVDALKQYWEVMKKQLESVK